MKFVEFLEEHRIWGQSAAIFTAWLCFVFFILVSLLPIFLVLRPPITFFKASLLMMLLSLLMTSYLTTKEHRGIFISWALLGFALLGVCISVGNGERMVLLPVSVLLLSFVSFYGFTYKNLLRLKGVVTGLLLGLAMVFHLGLLSWDFVNNRSLDTTFSNAVSVAIEKKANEAPLEFIKSDEGRKLALEVYGLPPLGTSDETIEKAVKKNPRPIKQAQGDLLLFGNRLAKNPYFVIMDYYFSNLLTSKQK